MNIPQKAWFVVSKPKEFTKTLKKEKGFRKALIYFFMFTLFINIFSSAHYLINDVFVPGTTILSLEPSTTVSILPIPDPLLFIFVYFANIIMSLLAYIIVAGIFHLLVMLVKGKAGFEKTLQAYTYAQTPSLLLSPFMSLYYSLFGISIPHFLLSSVIVIPVFVYDIYLVVIFFSEVHKIRRGRVFFALFILPILIFVVLFALLTMFAVLVMVFYRTIL